MQPEFRQQQKAPKFNNKRRKFMLATGIVAGGGAIELAYLSTRDGGKLVKGNSRAVGIASSPEMPTKADVVVIGGGYLGSMTALFLAEQGIKVALCEKGVVAGESSGRSLGYIDSLMQDPAKMEIIERSKFLWGGMNSRVGADTGYRQTGVAQLINDKSLLETSQAWVDSVKGLPGTEHARILSSQEAGQMAIGSSQSYMGALYDPTDAIAEPQLIAPMVAEAVKANGGYVIQGCAVRGIETAAGKLSAVVTENGTITCDSMVLAGGAWSSIFLHSLGVNLPLLIAHASVARTSPIAGPQTPVITAGGAVIRKTLGGNYDFVTPIGSVPITPNSIRNLPLLAQAWKNMSEQLEITFEWSTFINELTMPKKWRLDQLSPFEKNRILMPETRNELLDETFKGLQSEFPAFDKANIVESWAGALQSTPDNMPYISKIPEVPGLFVATGFYFGLTQAPAGAEAIADLVMGNKPKIDLSLYRSQRFSDGSKFEFRM